ncbi:hypothetical protein MY04_4858 [Flammeovirga sp. MY04]|uniref:DUF6452 family protein n=1 Tax=Flammeovirga sp. MY04 TaxID=1191459 RepID=UPI0008061595|nr:DUF6452 family protein [Flammeovirga sp. MY04]ANQ52193.1 hypothetical protein MY04_4858 [Flammeovirga sp. MY04]
MKKQLFLLLCFSILLPSCEECGVSSEPKVSIYNEDGRHLEDHFNKVEVLRNGKYESIEIIDYFSISLVSDTTSFVFTDIENNTDTLTISYERNFYFQSKACGYVLDIEDMKSESQTTFKDVYIEHVYNEYPILYSITVYN